MAKKSVNPVVVGKAVLIRTVTHYHVGRIVEIYNGYIVLEDAAWVADTGRFSDALKSGAVNEAEPFPRAVAVATSSIVDVTLWTGSVPLSKK